MAPGHAMTKTHRLAFWNTVNFVGFSVIHVSQGSVATYVRCGGMSTQRCKANFLLSLAVKEFLKSVKIWQSYCQKFGGFLFLEHSLDKLTAYFRPIPDVYGSMFTRPMSRHRRDWWVEHRNKWPWTSASVPTFMETWPVVFHKFQYKPYTNIKITRKSSQRPKPPPGALNAVRPQRITWRHWAYDHLIRHYVISYRCSIVTESVSPAVCSSRFSRHSAPTHVNEHIPTNMTNCNTSWQRYSNGK